MLRLNMAVPPTDRNSEAFSSLGLVAAAVSGLLDPAYNANTSIQSIPNMDGFPNGRRLEDDVTDIEIRAVIDGYGFALNSLFGLPNNSPNNIVGDGVNANDKPFLPEFPYVPAPHSGYDSSLHR